MRHKHADKIMQFAKMVDAGYPIDKLVQLKIESSGWNDSLYPTWDDDLEYRVAIGFVEGKPVFEGDVLYGEYGQSFAASCAHSHFAFKNCTWTPPKTREQQLEDALAYMLYAQNLGAMYGLQDFQDKLNEFRKLLENKK